MLEDFVRSFHRLRIPVKWGTDSGGCGPASESQTQAKAMMREVDHFSQEKCVGEGKQHHFVYVISFLGSVAPDRAVTEKWSAIPVMWGAVPANVVLRNGSH